CFQGICGSEPDVGMRARQTPLLASHHSARRCGRNQYSSASSRTDLDRPSFTVTPAPTVPATLAAVATPASAVPPRPTMPTPPPTRNDRGESAPIGRTTTFALPVTT